MELMGPKLAEYHSLRDEIGRRSELQNRVFHLYIASVAGSAALVGSGFSTEILLIVVGLLGPLFGVWYFDHSFAIDTIGRFLAGDVEPSINRLTPKMEGHMRWERGYRIEQTSTKVAMQNLQVLQVGTFLLPVPIALVLLIRKLSGSVASLVKSLPESVGWMDLGMILVWIVSFVTVLVFAKNFIRAFSSWYDLVDKRRIDLNVHAVRRMVEAAFTNGLGAAVTSFTPSAQMRLPETQRQLERLSTLAQSYLEKHGKRVIIHVEAVLEEDPKGVLGVLWSAIRNRKRLIYEPETAQDVAHVRIRISDIELAETSASWDCVGSFTIRDEEIVEVSESIFESFRSFADSLEIAIQSSATKNTQRNG